MRRIGRCDKLRIFLADVLGVDLKDIVMRKLEENIKKYPINKSKGNNKKYMELKPSKIWYN